MSQQTKSKTTETNAKTTKTIRRLGTVAFVCGFSMMAFELVAARLMAPTIGSSTYIWTNVIGVIMAALSVGYYVGGKIADKRHRVLDLAILCLLTAVLVLLVLSSHAVVIETVVSQVVDARMQGLIVALLLFAPSSFFLGMISPYLVKLNLNSMESSGQSVANLSMLNAIGSIAGTFVTGFVLFELIGSRSTLVVVIFLLVAASWLMAPRRYRAIRILFTILIMVSAVLLVIPSGKNQAIAIDTAIANYIVTTGYRTGERRELVTLTTGPNGTQSAVYKNGDDELVFWYTKELAEVVATAKTKDKLVVFGGGTFTLPNHLAKKYPYSQVDVVEIDPGLEKIAKDYFLFQPASNLGLFFEDARTFTNQTTEKYDVILIDVYADASIPWQFTTAEYSQSLKNLIHDHTIIAVNVIGGLAGDCRELLLAIDAPYSNLFPKRLAKFNNSPSRRGNIVVVYSMDEISIPGYSPIELPSRQPFTDDLAPVEKLQQIGRASCRERV
jgi:predicted membrane-bound spermidine synthase